ncbi:MAG: hypothetical protein ACHQET_11955 [Chitinophagales bacterium]
MKKTTKLLAAASLAAGGALGVLFAPGKGSESRKKVKKLLREVKYLTAGKCSREELLMIKSKLERHQERLDGYLQKVDSLIEELDSIQSERADQAVRS